jgi:hypothetical protein
MTESDNQGLTVALFYPHKKAPAVFTPQTLIIIIKKKQKDQLILSRLISG